MESLTMQVFILMSVFTMGFIVFTKTVELLFNTIGNLKNKSNNDKKEVKSVGNVENFQKNLENINIIIQFVCKNQYNKVLKPLHQGTNGTNNLITDDILNDVSVNSVYKVLEMISEDYKTEFYKFINKDKFEYLVAEMTLDVLTQLSMELNAKAVKSLMMKSS